MLHVCSRRRVRLSWLQRATELETKATHVLPQAIPYLWWNGADLTRLHPLPAGELWQDIFTFGSKFDDALDELTE